MKKSGLDELEALSLDWNRAVLPISQSFLWCEVNFLPTAQSSKYFDPSKKIQEEKDISSPFKIRYDHGYLR